MWGGDTSAFTNCVLIAAPVVVSVLLEQKIRLMMGERRMMQEALFYGLGLELARPGQSPASQDRLVRRPFGGVRKHLEHYYSETGRPSIDPELMIRMLIVGYSFGIRSERRLCEEDHHLAYRWFCRLGLDGDLLWATES